eukprot:Rhum_TRINITY_DN4207_c0_g1::Rhum_TRINITY_DN4207_c0_g1_i1::g.13381::m.13381
MAPVISLPKHLHLYAAGSLASILGIHYFLDDTSDPSLTDLFIDERRQTIRVPIWITTDFHCPFSLVARASLATAAARYPHIDLEVKWHPALLYTSLPQAGAMSRTAWLEKFFTTEQAAGIEAAREVAVEKGRLLGLSLRPEPSPLVGSSINAHRVAFQVLEQYGPKAQDEFVVSVFKAMQEENEDVGSPWVLARLASRIGMDEADVLQYLHTEMDREVIVDFALLSRGGLEGKEAERAPVGQVPQMNFKGKFLPVIGLQSPDTYAEVLQRYDDYLKTQLRKRGVDIRPRAPRIAPGLLPEGASEA